MKKILFTFSFILPIVLFSQHNLYISSGTTVNANSMTLSDTNLNNHGTYNGVLKMTGTNGNDSYINNNGNINLTTLNIEGNNTINLENNDISILTSVNLNSDQASLYLGSANLILNENAQINNESNNRTISGSNGNYIYISKNHIGGSENFGNIGFELIGSAPNLGVTTIYRSYGALTINGNESIKRSYIILPTNPENINSSTARFYFNEDDLNSVEKSSLALFKSIDNTNWTEEGGNLNDLSYPFLDISNIELNTTSIWTMADNNTLNTTDTDANTELVIYPTPANNTVYIKTNNEIQITSLALYDISGKKIDYNFSSFNKINVSNLAEGIYLLIITSDAGKTSKKLVIKKN